MQWRSIKCFWQGFMWNINTGPAQNWTNSCQTWQPCKGMRGKCLVKVSFLSSVCTFPGLWKGMWLQRDFQSGYIWSSCISADTFQPFLNMKRLLPLSGGTKELWELTKSWHVSTACVKKDADWKVEADSFYVLCHKLKNIRRTRSTYVCLILLLQHCLIH